MSGNNLADIVTGNAAEGEYVPPSVPPAQPAFSAAPPNPNDLEFCTPPSQLSAPPLATEFVPTPFIQPFDPAAHQAVAPAYVAPNFDGGAFVDEPIASPNGPNGEEEGGAKEGQGGTTKAFWKLRFWQRFFDVNTQDVVNRVVSVTTPWRPAPFLRSKEYSYKSYKNHKAETSGSEGPVPQLSGVDQLASPAPPPQLEGGGPCLPDLYGPVWICITLWVFIGAAGNLARQGTEKDDGWFKVVGGAGALIFSYIAFVSFGVWGLMKYNSVPVAWLEVVSVYGYSFVPFIPAALICTLPFEFLQWATILVATLWSASYILLNFVGAWLTHLRAKWILGLPLGVLFVHACLGFAFKLKFFPVIKSAV